MMNHKKTGIPPTELHHIRWDVWRLLEAGNLVAAGELLWTTRERMPRSPDRVRRLIGEIIGRDEADAAVAAYAASLRAANQQVAG